MFSSSCETVKGITVKLIKSFEYTISCCIELALKFGTVWISGKRIN